MARSKHTPSSRTGRAGIVEIARRLGVSPSTVSRALRTETAHLVQSERRQEILDLADALHFTPNAGARMLKRGVSSGLSVVIPHDENVFFSEYYGRLLSCLLHAAAERGWDVRINTLRRAAGRDLRQSLQQIGLESSGLVYLGEPLTAEEVHALRELRRPLVLTKAALPSSVDARDLGLPVVGVDNLAGARSAATLLWQLGHRRVGLVLGPPASRDAHERELGYLEIGERHGQPVRPEWIYAGPFSHETGRHGFAALFARGRDHPTAVCCANDEIAFGVIDAARAAGLRCPEDLSVVGFDDGPWALACRPALTTIRQPLADLAERAVALLAEGRATGAPARRLYQGDLPAALVIRDSTRALGAR